MGGPDQAPLTVGVWIHKYLSLTFKKRKKEVIFNINFSGDNAGIYERVQFDVDPEQQWVVLNSKWCGAVKFVSGLGWWY